MYKNGYTALEDIDYFDSKYNVIKPLNKDPWDTQEVNTVTNDLGDLDFFDSQGTLQKRVQQKGEKKEEKGRKSEKEWKEEKWQAQKWEAPKWEGAQTQENRVQEEMWKKDKFEEVNTYVQQRKTVVETVFEEEDDEIIGEIPIKPVYYTVQRDGNFWLADYPVILKGLVDKNEYHQTVTKASNIAKTVLSKWCYSDKFVGSMLVGGVFLLVPYVPGLVLSHKRDKKIKAAVKELFDSVNQNWKTKGYKWTFTSFLSIKIKFTAPEKLTRQQTFLLLAQQQSLST